MKTYKLHVLYDSKDDKEIFRDIVVAEGQNLEQLHKTIIKSFDFDGDEMASFYEADAAWERGKEFPLEDLGDEDDDIVPMKKVKVESVLASTGDKLIYVYDFMRMSTFMCELTAIEAKDEKKKYPLVVLSQGDFPEDELDGDEDEEDDLLADDPDLAESYYTKVSKAPAGKKSKASRDDDDDDDLFANDADDDDFGDDDFGAVGGSDYDDYY